MNPKSCDSTSEQLPVVDQRDRLIATASRATVHQKHCLHRAAHILVFNSNGELLIQKRAPDKDRYPGYWDISVGGHVHVGESYESAARRELLEELSIRARIMRLEKLPASADTDWEHIVVFKARCNGPVKPNLQEIQAWRFALPSTIAKAIEKKRYLCTPALRRAVALWTTGTLSRHSGSTQPQQPARQAIQRKTSTNRLRHSKATKNRRTQYHQSIVTRRRKLHNGRNTRRSKSSH